MRILLAQVFLLGISTLNGQTFLSAKVILDVLTNHVCTSPDFDTRQRKDTIPIDYVALRARTHLLDIAISDGGRLSTYPVRADEVAFNKAVDRLADAIKTMEVAINDPGASHMSRTEAKDDLRALHARLLYSVRTEVRPKRHIFDGKRIQNAVEMRVEAQGKDFMKRFLERKEKMEKGGTAAGEKADAGGRLVAKDEKSVGSVSSSERSEMEQEIRRQLNLD